MKGILLVLLSVLCSAAGQLLLRGGVAGSPPEAGLSHGTFRAGLSLLAQPLVVAGLACWCASTLSWIGALTHEPLTRLYGIGALNYLLVPALAHLCFGDSFTPRQGFASLLIAAGVALLLSTPAGGTHATP